LAPPTEAASRAAVLESATGVELHLPLAGPGARAYAFIIDWHIRLVLFCAWYAAAAMAYNRGPSIEAPLDPDGAWFAFVVAPAVALYFLYHFVLEVVMRGRTPGKRIVGVRLVAHDGRAPTTGAFLVRNVFRLIDSFPLFYGVGLLATMLTPNRVRVGDLAAGTLLVYDRADAQFLEHVQDPASSRSLSATELEVVNDLLRRWTVLDRQARAHLGRELLRRAGAADEARDDATLHATLVRLAGKSSS
jgi:uncharacterized RDD family membrane protein YckC